MDSNGGDAGVITFAVQLGIVAFAGYGLTLTIAEEVGLRKPVTLSCIVAAIATAAAAMIIMAAGGPAPDQLP
jgi:hypothetical protein